MCLSIPGRVFELRGSSGRVMVGGTEIRADLRLIPRAAVGDYVLVHAGFAIQRYDEKEALDILRIWNEAAHAEVEGFPGPEAHPGVNPAHRGALP
ncbi:MAG: HypC/HybG/HupF family hydrogenase formation chaperone [Planctomycetota bacterium]